MLDMINSIRKENDMRKKDVLVSVIVPIYNTEKYLKKCVDSIIGQTYKNIEIILINDGATDNSGTICDEYAKTDRRITVFHNENAGLSLTRKFGVDRSRGEYVAFVDSDDWVEEDFLEKLLSFRNMQDVDLVTSGFVYEEEFPKAEEKRILIDAIAEGIYEAEQIAEDIVPCMMYEREKKRQGITASLCNKLLKTDVIQKVMKNSDASISLGEDGAIIYPLISLSKKIVVTHYCGYHYLQRHDSMVHSYTLDSFEKVYRLHCYLRRVFDGMSGEKNSRIKYEEYTTPFLFAIIRDVYGMNLNPNRYIPPYEIIPQGSRIVLYGAGAVGKGYEVALKRGEYATLAGWVDKSYDTYPKQYNIKSPARLAELEYDYILIAVLKEEAAEEITQNLLGMNVPKDKILWKKPVVIN